MPVAKSYIILRGQTLYVVVVQIRLLTLDGELKLYATMSLMNSQRAMKVEEVVADIWEHYIQIYLER